MSGILSHQRFVQVKPTSNITGSSFATAIQIPFTVPSGNAWIPSESFLSMKLTITSAYAGPNVTNLSGVTLDGGAADINTAPYLGTVTAGCCLSSNPISCMFDRCTHKINDVTVSTIDNVPMTSTALILSGASKPILNTSESDNPVWIFDEDIRRLQPMRGIAVGGVPTPTEIQTYLNTANLECQSNLIAARNVTRLKQLRKSPFNTSTTARLNWKPCFGLFDSDHTVPAGTRNTFEFNVSSAYRIQMINLAIDVNDTGMANTQQLVETAATAGQIGIRVVDMSFYMSLHEVYENPVAPIKMRVSEAWTSFKTLTSQTDTLSFTVPPSTYKLIVGFINTAYSQSTSAGATDFAPMVSVPGPLVVPFASNLREISLSYCGELLPQYPYDFSAGLYPYQGNVPSAGTDTEDTFRAYREVMHAMDAYSDMSGTVYTENSWSYNPLFVYRVYKQQGDISKNVDIRTRVFNVVNNINCFLIALYHREVNFDYDATSVLRSVNISDLI